MFERSYHFIPANRPKLFDRTKSLGADVYVFDLEDAVAREDKQGALVCLDEWLGQQQEFEKLFVRVNGNKDQLAYVEREFLLKYPKVGIVLPKVNSPAALKQSIQFYQLDASRRIIGLIEDAAGLQALPHILELEMLQAIGLGLEDFLSCSIFETSELGKMTDHIRSKIVLTAMACGIDAIDTISMDLSGGEQMYADVADARSAGFNGKFSIHPHQIEPINIGFSPAAEVLGKAAMLSEKLSSSDVETGYLRMAGEIISPPKLKKMQTINNFRNHHESTHR